MAGEERTGLDGYGLYEIGVEGQESKGREWSKVRGTGNVEWGRSEMEWQERNVGKRSGYDRSGMARQDRSVLIGTAKDWREVQSSGEAGEKGSEMESTPQHRKGWAGKDRQGL